MVNLFVCVGRRTVCLFFLAPSSKGSFKGLGHVTICHATSDFCSALSAIGLITELVLLADAGCGVAVTWLPVFLVASSSWAILYAALKVDGFFAKISSHISRSHRSCKHCSMSMRSKNVP